MKPVFLTITIVTITILSFSSQFVYAQQSGELPTGATLLFEDDFERSESQETTDEPGNGWTTNSKKRAGGNKQVDLKDGAMNIFIHETANHGVSVVHEAAFENGLVQLRFLLPEKSSSLKLDFADLKCKEVHAGHLSKVEFTTRNVEIADLKTGVFGSVIREARKAKTLNDQHREMLKTKTTKFKHKIKPNVWHSATVKIEGETMTVSVDDTEVGNFSSLGIAHPTKRTLRVAVPEKASIDDLKVYALPATQE